jgi:hypothetical protein
MGKMMREMEKPMSNLEQVLNGGMIDRVRRNHGLEHATMNILGSRYPKIPMAGHSDSGGFWLIGDIPTDAVSMAIDEAIRRLQNGEAELAIHANCGTNFVAAGGVAGLAAWAGMLGSGPGMRRKLDRLPLVITLTTLALMVAQPLGLLLQARVTTSGDPGSLRVVSVTRSRQGKMPAHRVLTAG